MSSFTLTDCYVSLIRNLIPLYLNCNTIQGSLQVEATPQSANVPKSCLTAFINYEMTFLHFDCTYRNLTSNSCCCWISSQGSNKKLTNIESVNPKRETRNSLYIFLSFISKKSLAKNTRITNGICRMNLKSYKGAQ